MTVAREKRADARRNITAILDAALTCLVADSEASVGEIARRAGVGRVTLYGHFSTRGELIEAVFARVVQESEELLDAVDLTGDARQALRRLVGSTWQIVSRFRPLLRAAQQILPPERVRAAHDGPMRHVAALIERGRNEGAFRSDLPTPWMVATFYAVVHTAAEEISADRLTETDASAVITATLLAAYTPPGTKAPAWQPGDSQL